MTSVEDLPREGTRVSERFTCNRNAANTLTKNLRDHLYMMQRPVSKGFRLMHGLVQGYRYE